MKDQKILSKLIKCKFIIGSLKANLNCNMGRENFLYDVMFVSNYRPLVDHISHINIQNTFKNDQFIFKTISNFAKNNLKLCVAFSSFRDDKEHLNYFEKENFFIAN